MNKNSLILISLVLVFAGCNDDEKDGRFRMQFLATYNGEPLEMFDSIPLAGGESIQFNHISLLVSEIGLQSGSTTRTLSDIELIDMSFDNITAAAEGYDVAYDVPAGNYTGLTFGVGVPPDLNSMTPSQFPSASPLSKSGYYWIPWSSYIFLKIEGRLDTAAPGNFETNFAYHTGSNPLYRILDAPVPIHIEEGKERVVQIAIDYANLLEGINIASNPQNHNPEDSVQIARIVNNLQSAITLFQ